MGEWIYTTVEFGGRIKRSDLDELVDMMADASGCWEAKDGYGEVEAAAAAKRAVVAYTGETNYGQAEALTAFLTDRGLTWRRTADPHYEWGGDITEYDPRTGTSVTTGFDGNDFTFPVEQLKTAAAEGMTLQAVIDSVAWADKPLPPVEIEEDEAQSTEQEKEPAEA